MELGKTWRGALRLGRVTLWVGDGDRYRNPVFTAFVHQYDMAKRKAAEQAGRGVGKGTDAPGGNQARPPAQSFP